MLGREIRALETSCSRIANFVDDVIWKSDTVDSQYGDGCIAVVKYNRFCEDIIVYAFEPTVLCITGNETADRRVDCS